jgi:hypothetical protein
MGRILIHFLYLINHFNCIEGNPIVRYAAIKGCAQRVTLDSLSTLIA